MLRFLYLTRKSCGKSIDYFDKLYYNNDVRQQKKMPITTDIFYLAGAIRIELISLVLETKAQPLYQTPKQRSYYITKKTFCQLF